MRVKPARSVHAVVEAVRKQIRTGAFQPGSMLPAETVLASHYGVSRGTIRNAIDVLSESGDLLRRPHSRPIVSLTSTASLASQGTEVYVWISRPIADEQALRFLKGISRGLSGTPYRMVVREPSRFVRAVVSSHERHFLEELEGNPNVAGAIIERDPFAENDDVMRQLIERGRKLVFVDTPPPPTVLADHVGTANVAAARSCVEHLLDLGHSRIAFVGLTEKPQPIQDRMAGYWRAMELAGVHSLGRCIFSTTAPEVDEGLKALGGEYARYLKQDGSFSAHAYRIVHELLSMSPRPTAVFAAYDVLAYWICACLEGSGVRVPEDISVVGFDWLARCDRALPDTLTTAAQDFEGFGRHAANLLIDRISGNLPPAPRYVLLDAPLVVRSSTASDLLMPASEPAIETRAMQPID